jgi:predicted DNA repair protein MutK
MAGASLLTLLDDISVILDDVSVMTKVAAKKTAGVLGDDLALNAEQVTGVKADRELPVVWAVAKGSFINKLILVPAALLISTVYPPLVTFLLMCGGLFLAYEGAEKVIHKFWPHILPHDEGQNARRQANADETVDLVAFEKEKIKGAIRTDFILSAEIIVITLGAAAGGTLLTKSLVLSIVAIAITVGVYGLVAGIVKIDDLGLYLMKQSSAAKQKIGEFLLAAAPKLMKFLSIAGTLAMFLVGGGILVHGIDFLHHEVEDLAHLTGMFESVTTMLLNGAVGLIIGVIVVAIITVIGKIRNKGNDASSAH